MSKGSGWDQRLIGGAAILIAVAALLIARWVDVGDVRRAAVKGQLPGAKGPDMAADTTQTLITALLGGGGALFIGALVKGYTSLRGGARASTREAITDIATARDDKARRRGEAERSRLLAGDLRPVRLPAADRGHQPGPRDARGAVGTAEPSMDQHGGKYGNYSTELSPSWAR
ncbi:hypothetical protein [Dactylosporangium cerinum]